MSPEYSSPLDGMSEEERLGALSAAQKLRDAFTQAAVTGQEVKVVICDPETGEPLSEEELEAFKTIMRLELDNPTRRRIN